MNIKENVSLREYNTFHIDVSAKRFVEINSEKAAIQYFTEHHKSEEKFFILGGGSNVLFVNDFDGIIIHPSMKGITFTKNDDENVIIEAAAGEEWDDVVNYCTVNGLYGIENLKLIPGLVGAAPIQNIGAYGVELVDIFKSLNAVEIESGIIKTFSKSDCKFAYRDSIFKNELKGKYLVTSIQLNLRTTPKFNLSYKALEEYIKTNGITLTLKNIANAIEEIRRSKLPDPDELGNAGSFFKNPIISKTQFEKLQYNYKSIPSFEVDENRIKIPAAWLIEQAGLKGKRLGNVGTHIHQPLVLVNYGGASGKEIIELMVLIQNAVQNKFEIFLDNEVNIIK